MTHARRTKRAFRPRGDSLEGRLVLSSGAAIAAQMTHAPHETDSSKSAPSPLIKEERHATHSSVFVLPASFTVSGALSVTVGAPATPTMSASSGTGAAVPTTALKVHGLAANNLDAANLALSKIPLGGATTVTITTGRITTTTKTKTTTRTPTPTPTPTTTTTTAPTTTAPPTITITPTSTTTAAITIT